MKCFILYFHFQTIVSNQTYEFICENGEIECYGNKIQACAIFLINSLKKSEGLTYNRELLDFIKCFMEKIRPNSTKNDVKNISLFCETPIKLNGVITKCGEASIGKPFRIV